MNYFQNKKKMMTGSTIEVEGYPLILEKSKGKSLKDYKIYGNSVQDGTPTPDTPIEIESVGDKTNNLFNMGGNFTSETKNGLTITYSKEEDCLIINGKATAEGTYGMRRNAIPNIPSTSYGYGIRYVSGTMDKPSGKYASAYFGASDDPNVRTNWKAMGLKQDGDALYVATCDKKYIVDFWIWISEGVSFDNFKFRVQLEKSTEEPRIYEPYGYRIPVKLYEPTRKNIADLSKIVVSTTTSHVKFKTDFETGTNELISEPTEYDYTMIYLQRDVGYKFEVGKTYYWGADITVSGKKTTENTNISFGVTYTGINSKTHVVKENRSFKVNGSFVYDGTQENLRLMMNFNIGSVEPAKVKFENIFVSEVNEFEPCAKLITKRSKNLINTKNSNVNSFINSSGDIGTSSGYGLTTTEKIYVKPSTTYVYSGMGNINATTVMRSGYQYDENDNPLKAIKVSSGEAIGITTETNCDYVILQYVKTEEMPMLEEGMYETSYEPYEIPSTNIYLNKPLRKFGNYKDYIDFENQKVFRQVGEEIYDENTSFSLPTGTYWNEEGVTTAFGCKMPTDGLPNTLGMECITNLLKYKKSTALDKKVPYISGNSSQIVFALKNETASNIEELKTFLADNNLQIVYALKEETPEYITLPTIRTNKGSNIIELDTNINPSNMWAKYIRK